MFNSFKFHWKKIPVWFFVMSTVLEVLSVSVSAGDIPYKIGATQGISVEEIEGRYSLHGKDAFKVTLLPAEGDLWNMESVSVLGLMVKNTGKRELVLDLMLGNDGATGWSNSALGRTIIKPGEELSMGMALCRSNDYGLTDPAYLRMSGKPNGRFRHWHMIDPAKVRNLIITGAQKGEHAFELSRMSPLQKIDDALMGKFPFVDKYGQYILKEWSNKTHSDEDLLKGIGIDKKLGKELGEPTGFTQYGGWKEGPKFKATGFFRTQKHKGRWWFVDPEGALFWSYGVTCVGVDYAGQTPLERDPSIFKNLPLKDDPEFGSFYTYLDVEDKYELLEDVPHYDFTRANLYRKYGKGWKERYVEEDLKRLKYCNLNTIGAWSDNEVVAKKKLAYTAMIHYEYAFASEKLPDPFNPETRAGLRKAMEEYPVLFKDDPWCLGAFVNNELHWENSALRVVASVLGYTEVGTDVKKVFRDWLKEKYSTVSALNTAWKTNFSDWDDLLEVVKKETLNQANAADCSALTTLLAEAFYKLVDEELERFSPGTLYFGSRFNSGSPEVLQASAKYADVISANIYWYIPHLGNFGNTDKPVLISEFHFVNVAGNNLGSGLRSAYGSVQQGRLYKAFVEDAVKHPHIVGAHWFQWRDQNVAGRYDGENYDVGFFDVTDMPNEDLIRAASECGRNLYDSAK